MKVFQLLVCAALASIFPINQAEATCESKECVECVDTCKSQFGPQYDLELAEKVKKFFDPKDPEPKEKLENEIKKIEDELLQKFQNCYSQCPPKSGCKGYLESYQLGPQCY